MVDLCDVKLFDFALPVYLLSDACKLVCLTCDQHDIMPLLKRSIVKVDPKCLLFTRYFRFANPVCLALLNAPERSVGELKI